MVQLPAGVGAMRGVGVQLTRGSLEEFSAFAADARHSFTGELFTMGEDSIDTAFRSLHERGISQRYLVDPEFLAKGRYSTLQELEQPLVSYGDMPAKVHAKAFVRDGDTAFVSTGAFVSRTRERYEFVLRFDGPAAEALEGATIAAMSGNVRSMRAATARAASHGILMNDARAGSYHLTDTLLRMVDTADHRLVISTKLFGDRRLLAAVDRAAARGVPVHYTQIRDQGMHGNLLVADNHAYMGTAHFSPRSLGDRERAYRMSREVGIVTDDAAVIDDVLATMDKAGMKALDHTEFRELNRLQTTIDDASGYRRRLDERRAAGGTVSEADEARAARLEADAAEARPARQALVAQLARQRQEDGRRLTNLPVRTWVPEFRADQADEAVQVAEEQGRRISTGAAIALGLGGATAAALALRHRTDR